MARRNEGNCQVRTSMSPWRSHPLAMGSRARISGSLSFDMGTTSCGARDGGPTGSDISRAVGLTVPHLSPYYFESDRSSTRDEHRCRIGGLPMTIAITLTAFCTAIVIVSVLGGVLPAGGHAQPHPASSVPQFFGRRDARRGVLSHVAGGGAGRIAGDASTGPPLGLLALFFLERFFSFHHHELATRSPGRACGRSPPGQTIPARSSTAMMASVSRTDPRSSSFALAGRDAMGPGRHRPGRPFAGRRDRPGQRRGRRLRGGTWGTRGRFRRLHRDARPQAGRCADHQRP